jgi:hypothetical protein
MSKFRRSIIVAGLTVGLLLVGTAAYALVTNRSGSVSDQQRFVHDTDPFVTAAAAFTNVPTMVTSITLTSPHMFDARYTAESQCQGNVGWCSVRIVVILPSGALIELDPVVGTDFAFDSASTDQFEGHAIERTSQLFSVGTYRIQVQAAVVAGATQLRLDDQTLVVEGVQP